MRPGSFAWLGIVLMMTTAIAQADASARAPFSSAEQFRFHGPKEDPLADFFLNSTYAGSIERTRASAPALENIRLHKVGSTTKPLTEDTCETAIESIVGPLKSSNRIVTRRSIAGTGPATTCEIVLRENERETLPLEQAFVVRDLHGQRYGFTVFFKRTPPESAFDDLRSFVANLR